MLNKWFYNPELHIPNWNFLHDFISMWSDQMVGQDVGGLDYIRLSLCVRKYVSDEDLNKNLVFIKMK